MAIVAIDCGTTNTRVYVVDHQGRIIGKGTRKVGVKDTSATGSTETLGKGLQKAFADAIADAGLDERAIELIISSGMITSEIGLKTIPHLQAPVSCDDLAKNIVSVGSLGIFPEGVPVYFIPGVRNLSISDRSDFSQVGMLDFMRGEETQIAGILSSRMMTPPFTLAMLSSHTKYVSVDVDGKIAGSITTLSGQVFELLSTYSVIAKSLKEDDTKAPEDFSQTVVDSAYKWTRSVGILRSFLMPRFLDVLMDTHWYDRRTFLEACIATEDILALQQFEMLGMEMQTPFLLMGKPNRCKIYHYLLENKIKIVHPLTIVSDDEMVDSLTVQGLVYIARKANLIDKKELRHV